MLGLVGVRIDLEGDATGVGPGYDPVTGIGFGNLAEVDATGVDFQDAAGGVDGVQRVLDGGDVPVGVLIPVAAAQVTALDAV